MAFNNTYYGSTSTQAGGTFLDSQATVNISEGFNYGTSTEYVNIGDYVVEEFTNRGAFNQTLDLSLISPIENLKNKNSFFGRTFKSGYKFFTDFWTTTEFNNSFIAETNLFSVLNGLLLLTSTTSSYIVQHTGVQDITNLRIISKIRFSSTDAAHSFLIGGSGQTNATFTGYAVRINSTTDQVVFQSYTSGTSTDLSTGSFTVDVGTFYWCMSIIRNNNVLVYMSTNGRNYTKVIDYTLLPTGNSLSTPGFIGLRVGSGTGTFDLDFLDIQEIENQVTNEDIITSILAMGSVYNTSFESEVSGFNSFFVSGGSWYTGSSLNEIVRTSAVIGSTWDIFMTRGTTLQDFVADMQIKGSSGVAAGFAVGISSNFYGAFNVFAPGLSTGMEHYLGTSSYTYQNSGDHLNLQADVWYRVRVVKSNTYLGFYVNDTFMNAIYGTSLPRSDGQSINIALMVRNNVGSSVVFKDFRISRLDNLVDSASIDPNQSLNTHLSRYVPDGIGYKWANNTAEFFLIGSSRGEHDLKGTTANIIDSSASISNTDGYDAVIVNNSNTIMLSSNTSSRVNTQLEATQVDFLSDGNITSKTDARQFTQADHILTNRKVNQLDLTITNRPTVELYDKFNVVEQYLGLSNKYTVQGFTKSFKPNSGDFRLSLQLSKDE